MTEITTAVYSIACYSHDNVDVRESRQEHGISHHDCRRHVGNSQHNNAEEVKALKIPGGNGEAGLRVVVQGVAYAEVEGHAVE